MTPALIVGAAITLLGLTGVLGHVAESLAAGLQAVTGRNTIAAAQAAQSAILWGAVSSGLALVGVAAVLDYGSRRLTPRLRALALILIVGTDLWLNAHQFWSYMKPYGRDPLIDHVAATPPPYRVLDFGAYPGSVLATFDVPQVLGYHGNELRYYDELLGGKGEWKNLGFLPLWDLLAVRYAITPAGQLDSIPGFRRVLDTVPILNGDAGRARLFERLAPAPYARVVPAAIKVDSAAIIPTLLHPRMDFSRIVLFTNDQPITPEPLKQMELPPPSASRAAVTGWQPGRMTVTLDPAPPQPGYLLIAENWYPDWQATADGRPAQVLRGDYTLLTVAVPAGAKVVDLTFHSKLYELGRTLTIASLVALFIALLAAVALPRRAAHG